MSDLLVRRLNAADLDLFNHYPEPPTTGVGKRRLTFDEYVAVGEYRAEWTWVALRGTEVVARAAFWGPSGTARPYSLDWFDPGRGPDRVDTGAALLSTAYGALAADGGRPDYHLFLPADWRDVDRLGLHRACELTVVEIADMPGERGWWRLAHDAGGDLVGLVLPTRNTASATIGYIGVVPEHRGNHYSDDLVAEALHIFVEAGESEVNDSTDVGNAPMAAAFDRIGYTVTGRRIILG